MKFRSVVMGLTALGVLTSFSACKPIRSEQGAKPVEATQRSTSGGAISNLEIDFVSSDVPSETPDHGTSVTSDLLEGVTRGENSVQLKKRIPIPYLKSISEKDFFLVIPYSQGERRIVGASYEYRTLTPSNDLRTHGLPTLLFHDDAYDRYYISLNKLFQENAEVFSSQNLQILDLTLQFNDGSSSPFEIRFYVKPDLPSVEQIRTVQNFLDPKVIQAENVPSISAKSIAANQGWTILSERYTNPTSGPLLLWFSSAGISYQLETELGMKLAWKDLGVLPAYRPSTDLGFEPDFRQVSIAVLENVRVVLKDVKDGKSQTLSLSPKNPTPVKILSGQTLDVEWQVTASEATSTCQDGAPASRTFWSCDTSVPGEVFSRKPWPACKPPAGGGYSASLGSFLVPGVWAVKEYRVVGEFKNDVQVTEEFAPLSEALVMRTLKTAETTNPSSEKYPCQGIF